AGALESRARASAPPCSRQATRRAVRGRDGGRAWGRGASRGEFYSSGAPRELWRRRQAPSTAVAGSKYLVIAYGASGLLALLARRWRFRCQSRSRARGTQRKVRSCARAAIATIRQRLRRRAPALPSG